MAELPDRQTIRADLETTRLAYHELLSSLTDDDWRQKSANPDLTVKEVMWHIAWATGWIARSIAAVKRGRGIGLPQFLVDPGRKFVMRWLARRATREAAALAYDEGHEAILTELRSISDDEWTNSAQRFGEVRTVAWHFPHVTAHFEEHAEDVRRGLRLR